MWPHKAGLGVRLSYGVFGNPNVEVESASNANFISSDDYLQPKITFPRNEGDKKADQYLNEVLNKPLLKKPLNHSVGEVYQSSETNTSFDDENFGTTSVPSKILSSYGLETKAIDSAMAYDPGFGDIVQKFQIKPQSTVVTLDGLVHVTGEALSVLSLSIILQDARSIKLSPTYEVDFLDQIRQVEVAENEEKSRLIILVRTRVKVYVSTCKLSRYSSNSKSGPNFQLSIIKEISAHKLQQSTFADVAVCAANVRKFAIVDIQGNLSAWIINRKHDKVLRLGTSDMQLSIIDTNNLSNWLRLTWLPNVNSILLSTRTMIVRHDFDTATQKALVTSNTWSRIRDIQCVGDMLFYLTSKELIWLRCGTEIERLLSWKHFLNDCDPSLRLLVFTQKESYSLFIYSQASPLVLVYSLGYEDAKPCSSRDPYMIQLSDSTGLKQLIPSRVIDSSDIDVIELSSTLHLRQRRLQFGPLAQNSSSKKNGLEFRGSSTTKHKHRYRHRHSEKLHAALLENNLGNENEELIEAIQNYASQLGAAFEADNQKQTFSSGSYHSLLEIDHHPPLNILDLGDLDDMISEFETSSLTEGINIKSFINNALIKRNEFLTIPQAQTHICDIHTLLQQVFGECNTTKSITNTSLVLGLSLIKCQDQGNQFQTKYNDQKSASNQSVQELLDEWDFSTTTQAHQQPVSQTHNASQTIPLLKSSQLEPMEPPKLSQSSNTQLGGLSGSSKGSTKASQQRSHSRLADTLRISSQRSSQDGSQPKRKKKKGGF